MCCVYVYACSMYFPYENYNFLIWYMYIYETYLLYMTVYILTYSFGFQSYVYLLFVNLYFEYNPFKVKMVFL